MIDTERTDLRTGSAGRPAARSRAAVRSRDSADRRSYEIAALSRALDVLELLADRPSLGQSEVAALAGLHKVTAFRILTNLERRGYVQRDRDTGRYGLGLKLIHLGGRVSVRLDLRAIAHPFLEQLQERSGETVNLALPVDGHIAYIDILESPQSLRMAASVGSTDDLHSTALGKAMLAWESEAFVVDHIRRFGLHPKTARTIGDQARFLAELRTARERGYATDDEENEPGARCVAASVLSHGGDVVAGISISGPASRMTLERLPELGGAAQEAARLVSEQLGYLRPGIGHPADRESHEQESAR